MSNMNPEIYALITDLQKNNIRIAVLQDKIATQLGITINETYILGILFDAGPQTAGSLAKRLTVTPAAITSMTGKLIEKRYIKREYDQNDRRKVLLAVDELPQDQIKEITSLYSHGLADIFSSMNIKDLAAIVRFTEDHKALLESVLKYQ